MLKISRGARAGLSPAVSAEFAVKIVHHSRKLIKKSSFGVEGHSVVNVDINRKRIETSYCSLAIGSGLFSHRPKD
jgi:hypothetical protein